MSYFKMVEYTLLPEKPYALIKNCPGCGIKTNFLNTGCFRVNANGNNLDIWVIYRCSCCKHTWNMTVYERKNAKSISKTELDRFMNNSKELVYYYGTNSEFLARNRAEIDWNSIYYTFKEETGCGMITLSSLEKGDYIVINNTYHVKIRTERLLANLFQIARSQVKDLIKNETFLITVEPNRIVIKRN